MAVSGETTYTLTSITFDGAGRIAHLATKMTSSMNQGAPAGGTIPPFAMDTRMSSEGTADVNIDRGIVLHTEQLVTTDGTMRFGGSNPAMPARRTHGTTKVSSSVY